MFEAWVVAMGFRNCGAYTVSRPAAFSPWNDTRIRITVFCDGRPGTGFAWPPATLSKSYGSSSPAGRLKLIALRSEYAVGGAGGKAGRKPGVCVRKYGT